MAVTPAFSPMQIVADACRLLFQKRGLVANLAVWPLALFVIAALLLGQFGGTNVVVTQVFLFLLLLVFTAPFSTACHRIMFHHPTTPPSGSLAYRFTQVEALYIRYRLGLLALFVIGGMLLPAIVFSLVGVSPAPIASGQAGGSGPAASGAEGLGIPAVPPDLFLLAVLSLIPVMAVLLRLALVLPAVSIKRPINLREAWRLGTGNTARILATYALAALALGFLTLAVLPVMTVVAGFFDWSLTRAVFVLLAGGALSLAEYALMVTVNALIYRALVLAEAEKRGAHVDFEAD